MGRIVRENAGDFRLLDVCLRTLRNAVLRKIIRAEDLLKVASRRRVILNSQIYWS